MPLVQYTDNMSSEDKLRASVKALFSISTDPTAKPNDSDSAQTLLEKYWRGVVEAIAVLRKVVTNVPYLPDITPNVDVTDNLVIDPLVGDVLITDPEGVPTDRQELVITLRQDDVGGHGVSWGPAYKFTSQSNGPGQTALQPLKTTTLYWEWYAEHSAWINTRIVIF